MLEPSALGETSTASLLFAEGRKVMVRLLTPAHDRGLDPAEEELAEAVVIAPVVVHHVESAGAAVGTSGIAGGPALAVVVITQAESMTRLMNGRLNHRVCAARPQPRAVTDRLAVEHQAGAADFVVLAVVASPPDRARAAHGPDHTKMRLSMRPSALASYRLKSRPSASARRSALRINAATPWFVLRTSLRFSG